jgi:hypothetical protein
VVESDRIGSQEQKNLPSSESALFISSNIRR